MVVVPPGDAWQSQDTGIRMELNPAAFTALMSVWLVTGLPHAVSLQMASSVLPRFQPTVIWLATVGAVGSVWATAAVGDSNAKMVVDSNAMNAAVLRHFAAEGLRSDMGSP